IFAEPDLIIDGGEGGATLASIEAAASLPDGSLVVFDGDLGEVHLFRRSENFRGRSRRRAPVPGNCRSRPASSRATTILVLDNGAAVVFGPGGKFVREQPLFDATLANVLPGAGRASIESPVADGRVLVRVIDRSIAPPEGEPYRIPATYAIWDRSAGSVD